MGLPVRDGGACGLGQLAFESPDGASVDGYSLLTETRTRFPGRYCILFLNGAGAHICGDLVVSKDMHVEFLPPYSAALNPVEPMWDYIREHYFANRVFPTIEQVGMRLCRAFRDLDANPRLVQSITGFDWIKAAIKPDKLT